MASRADGLHTATRALLAGTESQLETVNEAWLWHCVALSEMLLMHTATIYTQSTEPTSNGATAGTVGAALTLATNVSTLLQLSLSPQSCKAAYTDSVVHATMTITTATQSSRHCSQPVQRLHPLNSSVITPLVSLTLALLTTSSGETLTGSSASDVLLCARQVLSLEPVKQAIVRGVSFCKHSHANLDNNMNSTSALESLIGGSILPVLAVSLALTLTGLHLATGNGDNRSLETQLEPVCFDICTDNDCNNPMLRYKSSAECKSRRDSPTVCAGAWLHCGGRQELGSIASAVVAVVSAANGVVLGGGATLNCSSNVVCSRCRAWVLAAAAPVAVVERIVWAATPGDAETAAGETEIDIDTKQEQQHRGPLCGWAALLLTAVTAVANAEDEVRRHGIGQAKHALLALNQLLPPCALDSEAASKCTDSDSGSVSNDSDSEISCDQRDTSDSATGDRQLDAVSDCERAAARAAAFADRLRTEADVTRKDCERVQSSAHEQEQTVNRLLQRLADCLENLALLAMDGSNSEQSPSDEDEDYDNE